MENEEKKKQYYNKLKFGEKLIINISMCVNLFCENPIYLGMLFYLAKWIRE